ncbi:CYTH domain-containing protein [Paenibacillus sp. GYB003]|uniref:CYTH domain-containing protein n=1 Tax=Paenibacillus sp. GYB003 TaxID=2994392 RepID=UPI002F968E86
MEVALRREAKFICEDFDSVRDALAELGAQPGGVKLQTDYIFTRGDVPGGKIKARDEGGGVLLVYVYARADDEREVRFDYFEIRDGGLVDLLRSLYGEPTIVRKRRERWADRRFLFHLDEVEGVGNVFEIETVGNAEPADLAVYGEKLRPYMRNKLDCSNEDLIVKRGRLP